MTALQPCWCLKPLLLVIQSFIFNHREQFSVLQKSFNSRRQSKKIRTEVLDTVPECQEVASSNRNNCQLRPPCAWHQNGDAQKKKWRVECLYSERILFNGSSKCWLMDRAQWITRCKLHLGPVMRFVPGASRRCEIKCYMCFLIFESPFRNRSDRRLDLGSLKCFFILELIQCFLYSACHVQQQCCKR